MAIPFVTDARYEGGYRLWLQFSDGSTGIADLSSELYGEVFEPLKDESKFKQFKINKDFGTLEWDSGADFAPEFLRRAIRTAA